MVALEYVFRQLGISIIEGRGVHRFAWSEELRAEWLRNGKRHADGALSQRVGLFCISGVSGPRQP